ncbi:hypothetical protein JTB14_010272 [Gonioctena quinquepunctata]|nr:hypothetical protein JTB14_010272 [Gonioctena quinquepunctata]
MAGRDVERDRLIKKITEKRAKLEARGDLNIKVRRLTLPSDFNIEDRSLFSLPPELLKPIVASAHPKYKRKLAAEKRKAAEQQSKLKSYTDLKRQREEFRNRLVKLIVGTDEDHDISDSEIPSAEEKEMLRYYYYVKHGVDTAHVAPLDGKVLSRVLALVPRKLMVWEQTLSESIQDVKEDFMMAVKKAIIDFVLQDPNFVKTPSDNESQYRRELKMIGNSFRPSYNAAKLKMERNLHVVNPCLAALIDLWYRKDFRKLRLIKVDELKAHEGAFELQDFKYTASKHIQDCRNILTDSYYREVVDIFLLGYKRKKLPDSSKKKKMRSYYNSVATIMTYHLQALCLKSLYEYVNFITDVKFSNKGFQIKLQQRVNILAFEPPFRNFRDTLIHLVDDITDAVMDIPRLETNLYVDWQEEAVLKPIVPEETVMAYKIRIRDMLEDQRIGPELRVQDFDEFLSLINGKDEQFIEQFLQADHSFEEYIEQILKYKAIMDRIPLATEHVVRMEMYDMNRTDLIHALEMAAESFKDTLIRRCTKNYQQVCKALGEEYQAISDKALSIPETTAELMDLIKFVYEVETNTLLLMEDRLRDVMGYILFLADHALFTPVEMKQNNIAFQW